MIVVPREYSSAVEMIRSAKALHDKLRPIPVRVPQSAPVIVAPPPAVEPPAEPDPMFPPKLMAQFQETWKPAPAPRIRKMVADKFDLTLAEITNQSHHRKYVLPRQIAMYLCVRYAGTSFPHTGRLFGGKDHTTVMYALRCMERDLPRDAILFEIVANFVTEIEGWT